MAWQSQRQRLWAGTYFVLLLTSVSFASDRKQWPEKYAVVYMPVSLADGIVSIPFLSAHREWYDIIIEAEKPQSLPFQEERCMLGATLGPLDVNACGKDDPLLRAEWAVWDAEHAPTDANAAFPPLTQSDHLNQRMPNLIARGSDSDPTTCACKFTAKHIYRQLGSFPGEAGKKYVVQVRFTKDATALNVTNPRLIIIRHGDFW